MRRHGCRYDSALVLSRRRSRCQCTVCSMCWQAERDREALAVAAAQAELAAQVLVYIVACAFRVPAHCVVLHSEADVVCCSALRIWQSRARLGT